MNILNRRVYVVSIFGRTHRVNLALLLLAYCYHAYKDALSLSKGSQMSNFRLIGSYVR